MLENVPPEEAAQIEEIVNLTIEQLKQRFPGEQVVRRGVHPKDHGCVMAYFTVLDDLPDDLRVGVFADPGREYQARIRFSNAAVSPLLADSAIKDNVTEHGSRGMAVKLMGVAGTPLVPTFGPLTQDFLMINQPVFAFSNVEDYLALSQALLAHKDDAAAFFARIKSPDAAISRRAKRTFQLVGQIKSNDFPPAFQPPPASPLDNRYFSASPYLFGDDHVMKFSADPVAPMRGDDPDVADPIYLRKALHKRLTAADARTIVFEFKVQRRDAAELADKDKIDAEIEDACFEWDEHEHPFVTIARITIPPQDFETDERRAQCESLSFTPWHGLAEHRPLGGINRLRRAVYEASTRFRHLPKEPARF